MILFSCGTTHNLSSGKFSKIATYKVKSYYGCCGCEAKYFLVNKGRRKIEQIIYSYNCGSKGTPTKFIFNYNRIGYLVGCEKYITTTLNDFTMKLSSEEKDIFAMIDSSAQMIANYTTIKFSDIKGFRKPINKEVSHSFPLIRKGYKLPIL